jgi:hypothetical protein
MPAARQLKPVAAREVAVEFDPQSLSIDEIERFEEITGDDFDEAFRPQPLMVDGKPLMDGNGQIMFRQQNKTKHLRAVMRIMLERSMSREQAATEAGKLRLSDVTPKDSDSEGKEPSAPESAPSSPSSTA